MFLKHNSQVAAILENQDCLSEEQKEILVGVQLKNQSIFDYVIAQEWLRKDFLWELISDALGVRYVREVSGDFLRIKDRVIYLLLKDKRAFPLSETRSSIDILVGDPFDLEYISQVSFVLKKDVNVCVSTERIFSKFYQRYYSEELKHLEVEASAVLDGQQVIDLVDGVLEDAVEGKASDIHFETFEAVFQVRFRMNGHLDKAYEFAQEQAASVIARLKVMANLDITQRRVGQDGRFERNINGSKVDFRISTLPTQLSESAVIRVLDASRIELDFEQLSFDAKAVDQIMKIANKPSGIFLVTGPTGSGKTTTLSAVLRELNKEEVKIITVEDPVEYEHEGIMQVSVKESDREVFSDTLRAFLRNDPDKMMIGEIRDLDTAKIAIQAALTGHMIFSTLHTYDAVGAVMRLIDLGVEPYLVAATLSGVLAQRLVRKVCEFCKDDYQLGPDGLAKYGERIKGVALFHGLGCSHCNFTGYRGRIVIFELLEMTQDLRELISRNAPMQEIHMAVQKEGLKVLELAALDVLKKGLTTIDEVSAYILNEKSHAVVV